MRPATYWRIFRASQETILASLGAKVAGLRFPPTAERRRQQYWWRGFRRQRDIEGIGTSLEALRAAGIIAATHSFRDRVIHPAPQTAYPILAVTAVVRAP